MRTTTNTAIRVLALFSLTPISLSASLAHAEPSYDELETAIVAETNFLRSNPAQYAEHLRSRLSRYEGRRYVDPDGDVMWTREGASAVREAIGELVEASALSPLTRETGLDDAAAQHAADQRGGRIGHVGSDGTQPYQRVALHYEWDLVTVENIYYGGRSARDIVVGLLIDDGVGNRGHRHALLDERVEVTGVACGPHEKYETVCVMEYTIPQRDVVASF